VQLSKALGATYVGGSPVSTRALRTRPAQIGRYAFRTRSATAPEAPAVCPIGRTPIDHSGEQFLCILARTPQPR